MTPVTLLIYPPFWAGLQEPGSVEIGDEETTEVGESNKYNWAAGTTVGWEADFELLASAGVPIPLLGEFNIGGGVYGKLSEKWTNTTTTLAAEGYKTSIFVRQQYRVKPDVEHDGTDSAAVAIGLGCFDDFRYQISDPTGLLGAVSDTMLVNVPVGVVSQVVGLCATARSPTRSGARASKRRSEPAIRRATRARHRTSVASRCRRSSCSTEPRSPTK